MKQEQSIIELAITDLNPNHSALIFKSILSIFERHDDRGCIRISFFNYIYENLLLPSGVKKLNNIYNLKYYLG